MGAKFRFLPALMIGLLAFHPACDVGCAHAEDGGPGGGAGAGAGSAAGAGSSGGGVGHGQGEGGDGPSGASAAAGPAGGATGGGSTMTKAMGRFLGGLADAARNYDERGDPALPRGRRGELRREQNIARDAVSQGSILPLDQILPTVLRTVPGTLLSLRLRGEPDGRWIYRLVILTPEGVYRHVAVDAVDSRILQVK